MFGKVVHVQQLCVVQFKDQHLVGLWGLDEPCVEQDAHPYGDRRLLFSLYLFAALEEEDFAD